MSLITILETLLIGPLKLVFEIIFVIANRMIGHPGLAIIVLSLIMNILVLPLYKRADAMQEESRDMEAKLRDGAAHIKKTFSGDERMMILQTYYRQNHYKPTDALNGSVSLLLEVPFFMAAYQFLSHLEILNGVSLGPITDLGAPDGLLVIGGVAINLLPILMTLVNVISSAIYLKGFPLKTKIQLYAMALFFLVFLYTSPSCLVFYWTLNNVFSLVKTIFYKLKNPQKVLRVLTCILGIGVLSFGLFIYDMPSLKRKLFLAGLGIVLLMPAVLSLVKGKVAAKAAAKQPVPNKKMFAWGTICLTILVGVLIPSAFIAASPQEYVDVTNFHNPLWYIVSALCLAAGTFLVWMNVFYWLASPKGKAIFHKVAWVLFGIMLMNYMFFGTDLGVISSSLQYESGMYFTPVQQLTNLVIVAAVGVILLVVGCKWEKIATTVLLTAAIALGGMSGLNVMTIKKSVDAVDQHQIAQDQGIPNFQLSQNGKNVIVLMLDRAMGQQVPYILNEMPQLREQFAGFTYYDNTISFGGYTNFGAPALLGGYEYTPVEMNKRSDELLVDKHNEAVRMMPVLFWENGYEVTVCDPIYPNYQWIPDLSVFDEYPGIDTYITKGRFDDVSKKEAAIQNTRRNFFCFSIMKTMPLILQTTLYNDGRYNQAVVETEEHAYGLQSQQSVSVGTGLDIDFMPSYNALSNYSNMTKVTEEEINTFLFISNDTTHEPMLLQTPDYVPSYHVDNTEFDAAHTDRFILDGKTMKVEDPEQMIHYHANLATLVQLGKWMDYLRANGVYDNTRIIIVADHGRALYQFDELVMDDGTDSLYDMEFYYPLLLVKDFNSTEFLTSSEFMTNADVPTLAVSGLLEDARNPFTGKLINNSEKTAHDQYVILSHDYDVAVNNGYTYLPAKWASVRDNLWEKENWTLFDGEHVLAEHEEP